MRSNLCVSSTNSTTYPVRSSSLRIQPSGALLVDDNFHHVKFKIEQILWWSSTSFFMLSFQIPSPLYPYMKPSTKRGFEAASIIQSRSECWGDDSVCNNRPLNPILLITAEFEAQSQPSEQLIPWRIPLIGFGDLKNSFTIIVYTNPGMLQRNPTESRTLDEIGRVYRGCGNLWVNLSAKHNTADHFVQMEN